MTRTLRKECRWYKREHPEARRHQRKSYRLLNKTNINKNNYEYEEVPRTEGWLTW